MKRSLRANMLERLLRFQKKPLSAAETKAVFEEMKAKGETAYELPDKLTFTVHQETISCYERPVYRLFGDGKPALRIVYFHGGGHSQEFMPYHWKFLNRLADELEAEVLALDYGLIPFANHADALRLTEQVYRDCLAKEDGIPLVFMGDSSGGGLALAASIYLDNQGLPLPDQLVLISPWLDAGLTNPAIASYQDKDPILTVERLRVAARHWADGKELADPCLSPLYGPILPVKTRLFVGTREIFYPDIEAYAQQLRRAGIPLVLTVGEGMNHIYPLLPLIPEAQAAQTQLIHQLQQDYPIRK